MLLIHIFFLLIFVYQNFFFDKLVYVLSGDNCYEGEDFN